MTTSRGASACTPNGFSALFSPPLSVLVPPPPLAQPVSREPPPAAATEARTARWRNSRREYWLGVPMGQSPLRSGDSGSPSDASGVSSFQGAVAFIPIGDVGRH